MLQANELTSFAMPSGLTRLLDVDLSQNVLTNVFVPSDVTNLSSLNLFFNQLDHLDVHTDLRTLSVLDLDFNRFSTLSLPPTLSNITSLHLRDNLLTNLDLPPGMTKLNYLDVGENQLASLNLPGDLNQLNLLRASSNRFTSLVLPTGMTNLTGIYLRYGQLTNLVLPPDLGKLTSLDVLAHQLTNLTLPSGLTNLQDLFLSGNLLTSLTLPPDMAQLRSLVLDGNPLARVILPEPLAATGVPGDVAALRDRGVSIYTYPLTIQLSPPEQRGDGAIELTLSGPPGDYTLLSSTELPLWSELRAVTNELGSVLFTDASSNLPPRRFYRARQQSPPPNMVFIPPTTFTMGSPATELNRNSNEGPQTIVTLTHGFWIAQYEVTQGEYLSTIGTNPSFFPGDLSRPISSVSWSDATNYCWRLTLRERAAGRIRSRSEYRLPTEAEWECAARARTTTRFSYGDDPGETNLANHAWFYENGNLTVHPVGQKLPNPLGLYDMEGNVWEWCQDWLGDLPGGTVTDPTGPPSNPIGWKVIRGGGYDFGPTDCRSARRFFSARTRLSQIRTWASVSF
jgi:formylglycine-generating enzyme required for sulfatase activity